MKLVAWVAENIRVDKDCNLGGSPITPEGVWKARTADAHSRDIFLFPWHAAWVFLHV